MNLRATVPVLTAGDDIHRMMLGTVLMDAISYLLARSERCGGCRAGNCAEHTAARDGWAVLQRGYDELAAGDGACVLSTTATIAVAGALGVAGPLRRDGLHPVDAALSAAYDTLAAGIRQVQR